MSPSGFLRSGNPLVVDHANAPATALTTNWQYDKTDQPGTYRVMFSTIDTFSRLAECWVEFEVRRP